MRLVGLSTFQLIRVPSSRGGVGGGFVHLIVLIVIAIGIFKNIRAFYLKGRTRDSVRPRN